MPITESAKKKLRQDKKRTTRNKKALAAMKKAVRIARLKKTAKNVQSAVSHLDVLAKKNIIHKNKAARLKSQLAKLKK